MRKTQNPLTDVAVLRLYVYLITTQSAVSIAAQFGYHSQSITNYNSYTVQDRHTLCYQGIIFLD
jgi:hypothetical protein